MVQVDGRLQLIDAPNGLPVLSLQYFGVDPGGDGFAPVQNVHKGVRGNGFHFIHQRFPVRETMVGLHKDQIALVWIEPIRAMRFDVHVEHDTIGRQQGDGYASEIVVLVPRITSGVLDRHQREQLARVALVSESVDQCKTPVFVTVRVSFVCVETYPDHNTACCSSAAFPSIDKGGCSTPTTIAPV